MKPQLATVLDVVKEEGVKIKVDGEKEAVDTYYNSVAEVSIGDRVLISYISRTIIIIGKLLY